MDDNKEPEQEFAAQATIGWDDAGNLHVSITGDIGPIHLWGASRLLQMEGDKMYVRAATQAPSSGLVTASHLPPSN